MVEMPLPWLFAASSSLRSTVKDTTVPDAKLSEIFLVSALVVLAVTVKSRTTPAVVAPVRTIVLPEPSEAVATSLPCRRPLVMALLIDATSWAATLPLPLMPTATSPEVAV